MNVGEKVRGLSSELLWTGVPIVLTGAVTALSMVATLTKETAPEWLLWTTTSGVDWFACLLWVAIALALFLIVKAVKDHVFGQSLQAMRYSTFVELRNKIGPAVAQVTELALLNSTATQAKKALLRTIAHTFCSALVAMTPKSSNVRATVFQLTPTAVEPLAWFGREDVPRSFALDSTQGQEIERYLSTGAQQAEIYSNTLKKAPEHYVGDITRYQTFVRVPILAQGIVFGMVTIDAPQKKSLDRRDAEIALFVARQLGAPFAITAS